MAQPVMPHVAATEPDKSRGTAAVLPLRSTTDRAQTTELLHGWLGRSSVRRSSRPSTRRRLRCAQINWVKTYQLIKQVAMIDTSEENDDANSYIQSMMRELAYQNLRFARGLKQTSATSENISQSASTAWLGRGWADRNDCGRRRRDCEREPGNQE